MYKQEWVTYFAFRLVDGPAKGNGSESGSGSARALPFPLSLWGGAKKSESYSSLLRKGFLSLKSLDQIHLRYPRFDDLTQVQRKKAQRKCLVLLPVERDHRLQFPIHATIGE